MAFPDRMDGLQQTTKAPLSAVNNFLSNSLPDSSKFTIPALKPKTSSSSNLKLCGSSQADLSRRPSNINQFLLKQLEPQSSNEQPRTDRFHVPKLKESTSGFIIPKLKSGQLCKVPSLGNTTVKLEQIANQQVHQSEVMSPEANDHIIDLTTALSSTRISNNSISINQKKKSLPETFVIPFIDCDRKEQFPPTDNYCLIDVSHMQFEHNLAPPSTMGRIFSSKMRRNRISEPVTQKTTFKAKHQIDRFLFDTKSPDDIVLASFNRFTRAQ